MWLDAYISASDILPNRVTPWTKQRIQAFSPDQDLNDALAAQPSTPSNNATMLQCEPALSSMLTIKAEVTLRYYGNFRFFE